MTAVSDTVRAEEQQQHLGVLDLLGGEHVPVLQQRTALDLVQVDLDLVGVVRVEDEGVDVGKLVGLRLDLLLDQVVLALVGEDNVDLLGRVPADVRSEPRTASALLALTSLLLRHT